MAMCLSWASVFGEDVGGEPPLMTLKLEPEHADEPKNESPAECGRADGCRGMDRTPTIACARIRTPTVW